MHRAWRGENRSFYLLPALRGCAESRSSGWLGLFRDPLGLLWSVSLAARVPEKVVPRKW